MIETLYARIDGQTRIVLSPRLIEDKVKPTRQEIQRAVTGYLGS